MIEDDHCVRTIHAEANAIVQAARNGVRIGEGSIYVTAFTVLALLSDDCERRAHAYRVW